MLKKIESRPTVYSAGMLAPSLRRTSAVVMLSIASIACSMSASASATALDQFKSFVASTKSAKGEFSQRIVKANEGDKAQNKTTKSASPAAATSTGRFEFARPGKFIWIYQKPYEQRLQADGEKLYIYDKDLNQVTVRKLGNALGSSPAAILFGSNDLEKNFVLKEVGTKNGLEWLDAVPKAKDSTFEHIGIGFKNGVPAAMELRDAFGQTSLLTFTQFEKNPSIGADQFKFVVPKGADVFDN
jgi:outer membrane lipoprotein carrier protein